MTVLAYIVSSLPGWPSLGGDVKLCPPQGLPGAWSNEAKKPRLFPKAGRVTGAGQAPDVQASFFPQAPALACLSLPGSGPLRLQPESLVRLPRSGPAAPVASPLSSSSASCLLTRAPVTTADSPSVQPGVLVAAALLP